MGNYERTRLFGKKKIIERKVDMMVNYGGTYVLLSYFFDHYSKLYKLVTHMLSSLIT